MATTKKTTKKKPTRRAAAVASLEKATVAWEQLWETDGDPIAKAMANVLFALEIAAKERDANELTRKNGPEQWARSYADEKDLFPIFLRRADQARMFVAWVANKFQNENGYQRREFTTDAVKYLVAYGQPSGLVPQFGIRPNAFRGSTTRSIALLDAGIVAPIQ